MQSTCNCKRKNIRFHLLTLICILTDKENVWRDVCNMGDEIPVNYDTIEQLFCQKELNKPDKADGPSHKVVPTKVGFLVEHTLR